MPIKFKTSSNSDCDFSEWSVPAATRGKLVEAVAYLYLLKENNARRVIDDLEPRRLRRLGNVADNVIDKLSAPRTADVALLQSSDPDTQKSAQHRIDSSIWHRDGLLFQHISWVAAKLQIPGAHMTPPHVRNADKGFDGFIIEIDPTVDTLERVIICEDKASEAPRGLITSSVWKEIGEIVAGGRDDETLAALTTLVKGIDGIDAEEFVDTMFWDGAREFRVSIATGENIRKVGELGHLLNGFQTATGANIKGRTGGVLAFQDVRSGLAKFALEVIAKVKVVTSV